MITELQEETLRALWERRLYRRPRTIHRHDRDAQFYEYFILDKHDDSMEVLTIVSHSYKTLCRKRMIYRGRCRDWRKRCSRPFTLITPAGLQELFG